MSRERGRQRTESLSDLRGKLKGRLRRALAELDQLVETLGTDRQEVCGTRSDPTPEVHNLPADSESRSAPLAERLAEAQKQASRLMMLYAVTYQLHATLEIEEVQVAIGEIAVDLLGAERFMLLMGGEPPGRYRIALKRGLGQKAPAPFAGAWYCGGDSTIDRALADGHLAVYCSEQSAAKAILPFTIKGTTVGALVVFDLLGRRPASLDDDRELLHLLAAQAASALWVARAYSTQSRKLQTLESLLSLVVGA